MGRQVKFSSGRTDANNPNVAPISTRALIEGGAVGVVMTSGSASTFQARGGAGGDEGAGARPRT